MKLFAYENLFFKKVSNSRKKEIDSIKEYQLQQNYLSSIWNFVPYLISLLCFSGYSLMGNKITVGQSFAVFSLLTKITEPIFLLPSFVVRIRKLSDSIDVYFENFENFKKEFTAKALSIEGSGWCWLVFNQTFNKIELITTLNQNSPWSIRKIPLLGLDMWEHSYYLKHQNKKSNYVESWWNVVNWDYVGNRFSELSD